MPIATIGRLESIVEVPPKSLDLYVFVDAGGRASERRLWGGLACIGDRELAWLRQKLNDLKKALPDSVEASGELKGKHVPISMAEELGQNLCGVDHRSVFWATWCPDMNDQILTDLRALFSRFLASQKTDQYSIEHRYVDNWFRRMESFTPLKSINQHKLICILWHLDWLTSKVRRADLAHQLRSVRVSIDCENFPHTEDCAVLVKAAVAASFQGIGMSCRLTGSAYREEATDGAVEVDLAADSRKDPGLQCVDILLQAVQRQLPGFAERGNEQS